MNPLKVIVKRPAAYGTVLGSLMILGGLGGPLWVKRDQATHYQELHNESHNRSMTACHLELEALRLTCRTPEEIKRAYDLFTSRHSREEREHMQGLTDKKQRGVVKTVFWLGCLAIAGSIVCPIALYFWIRGSILDYRVQQAKLADLTHSSRGESSPSPRRRPRQPKRPM